MSSHLRNIPGLRGSFGRGVATLVTGTGAAQFVVIAASPVLTRLYDPADFGLYSAGVSVLSLLLTFTCLRYEVAIPLPESGIAGANLLALSLLGVIGTSLLVACGLLILGVWVPMLLGTSGIAPYLLVLPLAQFGAGVGAAFTGWALRTRTFVSLAATRVTQGVALSGTQLALGVLQLGPFGLMLGDAVGRSAGSARLAWSTWRRDAALLRQVSWAGIVAAANRYRRFPLITTWSALLSVLGQQGPLLLLVALYGANSAGQYALAARIGALPLSLLAAAVGQVFVAEAANLARSEPRQVQQLFGRTTRVLALAGLLPTLLVMAVAPVLAGPIFGSSWATVGVYLAVLAPSFYLEFVAGATGDILLVLERQGLHLAREVARLLLIGGAIPIAALLGSSDVGAVALLSAARCVMYIAYGTVSWYAVTRFTEAHASIAATGELPDPSIASDGATGPEGDE